MPSIVEIIADLPELLVNMAQILYEFLFLPINFGSVTVSLWAVLSGVGLVVLIIVSIVNG